ncbi:mandelate racemase/muconate lactonizing enzyme family protein [Paraburkholderia sp. SARCC-3016]|uniref:mandelate racemase/muconate lactonizing enzyme family protein n=1 Tax=Paraburkholderia sp. SARCC-3016 TaxID=3058611 RepID=UPI0028092986|nr:mandelate racemase/muconate lactonizing enzyme family protein [Paraburkholderia sp. SARCC-3016]MDQ7977241.1 mandelate racemase/muconate lactonizing enzyme family protein [Paraburkholderia sp. SARCC-3016]
MMKQAVVEPSQSAWQQAAKIVSVEARTVRVPLDRVTSFATRVVAARDYTLVRIRTADGQQGIGFCYGGHRAGSLVTHAVRELFGPLLIDRCAVDVEGLWRELYQESLLQGRAGSVMRALSIVDVALWDRNARAAGLPLARYLGGMTAQRVPAYASGGYYVDGKTPQQLGEELAGYVEMGFRAVKMKVGRLDPRAEEARIAAARAAIGDSVLLMLDANNAWSDVPTALEYMRRYERYDPYWIEEPFSPDDIESHAQLAKRTPVTVATGEIEAGRWRHQELLDKRAAMILQSDAAVCGGISEWRRIAAAAAGIGATMCPHWFHDLHVHLVASTANARYVEYFPDDQVLNFRRLVDTQLEFADGMLKVPTTPGLGFDFDAAALERYALDGWS